MTALKTNMMQVRIQTERAVTPCSKISNIKAGQRTDVTGELR